MTRRKKYIKETVEGYDEEAEATGWLGPQVAFGLMYKYIQPGQSILDIGIGTGLGSVMFQKAGLRVYGMDLSREMLEACRRKGFADLTRHDLVSIPYPYEAGSMNHAICVGVFNFFSDLSPVFMEVARILEKGGLFVFAVGDRAGSESPEILVGPEHTKTGESVTMYRHGAGQVGEWCDASGFSILASLSFSIFMDREKSGTMRIRIFLARKGTAE